MHRNHCSRTIRNARHDFFAYQLEASSSFSSFAVVGFKQPQSNILKLYALKQLSGHERTMAVTAAELMPPSLIYSDHVVGLRWRPRLSLFFSSICTSAGINCIGTMGPPWKTILRFSKQAGFQCLRYFIKFHSRPSASISIQLALPPSQQACGDRVFF